MKNLNTPDFNLLAPDVILFTVHPDFQHFKYSSVNHLFGVLLPYITLRSEASDAVMFRMIWVDFQTRQPDRYYFPI